MTVRSLCRSFRTLASTVRPSIVGATAAVALSTSVNAQSITSVGVLPGGSVSDAVGVSSDGAAVAGTVDIFGPGPSRAFRWTRNHGPQNLGVLPGGTDTWATAISGNGEALAGIGFLADTDRAVRWTRSGGLQNLGVLPGGEFGSEAYGISHNGAAVAGTSSCAAGFHAFRWTSAGMADLGTLPGGAYSYGFAISGNGEAVTGIGDTGAFEHAFYWTRGHGMRDLGTLHPDEPAAGFAISADGGEVTGYSGGTAVLWHRHGVLDLGIVPGGSFSVGYSISGNGRVVGGLGDDAEGHGIAMLWTRELGMVDLNTYLPTRGVDLSGWSLSVATGLSADGSTIVGIGTFNGEARGWVVTLPCHGAGGHGHH